MSIAGGSAILDGGLQVNQWVGSLDQHFPSCIKGTRLTSQSKLHLILNRHKTLLQVSFASRKSVQSHKANDLDKDLVTEADLPNKPLGFGEGKVYDTSLEDKLLEEIERENTAKAAAAQKRKEAGAIVTKSNERSSGLKNPPVVRGIKVWIGDLPKKKNIDRDLRSVFRAIPGLLDISPVVQGNDRTRDPICKGYGYLTFDTPEHAKKFIMSFQNQTIMFGKVVKQISFRLMQASDSETTQSNKERPFESIRLRIRDKGFENVVTSNLNTELTLETSAQTVSVNATEEALCADSYQPQVEVVNNGEMTSLFDKHLGRPLDDEGHSDELNSDGDQEFEISVHVCDSLDKEASLVGAKRAETIDKTEAERRIEELEGRIKLKLTEERDESKSDSPDSSTKKAKGFNAERSRDSKRSPQKVNNVAAVTHGLKGRERQLMTGVLEKYGRKRITSN